MIEFTFAGLDEMEASLNGIAERINGEAEAIMRTALQPVFDESQALVPVQTGVLKDSGFIAVVRTGNTITGTIGYDSDHAWEVHENLERQHPNGKQAKYLEGPWLRQQADVTAFVKDRLASILNRSSGDSSGSTSGDFGGGDSGDGES